MGGDRLLRKYMIPTMAAVAVLMALALFLSVKETEAFYGDIVLNNKAEAGGMNPVVFPHWWHRVRFKCKVCHEQIFIMKKGANDITMDKIFAGEYCGKCHNGTIAWEPSAACMTCHSGTPTAQP